MTLRPQNKASPSSATSAIMWLLRSIDHSLSASAARSACAAGIMREPGSLAPCASASSPSIRNAGLQDPMVGHIAVSNDWPADDYAGLCTLYERAKTALLETMKDVPPLPIDHNFG